MQNKIRKKNVLKFLKRECEKLEPEEYTAHPKTFGVPDDEKFERKKVDPFWYSEPTEYKVNHKRRAFQAYKDEGMEGVNKYFIKHNFELSSLEPIWE
jgi:hypothetical protein